MSQKYFDELSNARSTRKLVKIHPTPLHSYCFVVVTEIPKHAHLQFYTLDKKNVLSFVDYRRFGSWKINGDWGPDRGPDPVTQYQVHSLLVIQHFSAHFKAS